MKLKLAAKRAESPGVMSFIFKPEQPLVWTAGQFLHYVLNHRATDDRGSDRWFTIASAPFEKHVMLTTRLTSRRGSTFKRALKKLKDGDIIEVSDLDGDFVIKNPQKDYVFIAGGIGITPFRAILMEAAHAGTLLRVRLLYANRGKVVTAYQRDLEDLGRRNPNLRIFYVFRPKHLDEATIREYVPDLRTPQFFVSGPEPMVERISRLLEKMGVVKKHIKLDWFPGYPAEPD
ncbi:MAG: FAD-dependent oxidoreductase [Verrucomicrobiota bacterium]|jgi:ferredoxin-NADP reductase